MSMIEKIINIGDSQCLVCFPETFREDKEYPTILFLHGVGAANQSISTLQGNAITSYLREADLPFVLIEPHCEENTWFHNLGKLERTVEKIRSFSFVDNSRFYLTGNSMGGYAAWMLAMLMKDCFAALVPVCGGGMVWCADSYVDLPIWSFHGMLDETVPVDESIKMVSAVNSAGGNAKITLYEKVAHNCWDYAYRECALYEWLLGINRKNR